jgi:hypothetical protein
MFVWRIIPIVAPLFSQWLVGEVRPIVFDVAEDERLHTLISGSFTPQNGQYVMNMVTPPGTSMTHSL